MRNQRGQAAILVALMFNVLFVFFAMSINVALVVHDKINLQNSVDMAVYYAAMKQSEIINAIAHENYMMRQSWKLLAWRYHVLGTMGLYRQPSEPNPVWSGDMTDTVYPPSVSPSVCVTYKPTWKEVPDDESLCNTENLKIPPLPEVKVIAGFLGINEGIHALSVQLRAQFDAQCERHGAYNWWFAASILQAYRTDQRYRKEVIYALAKNLSGGQNGDFVDLDGNSVLAGAKATFLKNLTYSNKASFEASGGDFKLFNSLSGIDYTQWLVEIKTVPSILYTDVDLTAGCNAVTEPINNLPQRPQAVALLRAPLTGGGLDSNQLIDWMTQNNGILQDSDWQFANGFEKNPWYMAYMGVQASTTPREIFFPTKGGVQMKARAYAKPFGGRIGPWYRGSWNRGDPQSSGDLVDPLLPPRLTAGGLLNDPQDPHRLPNYSRYPGDQIGMSSHMAINALTGMANLGISFNFYTHIKEDYSTQGALNDPMAWDGPGGGAPDVRNFETAAIAPDLFDITYYSVEPNFSQNYYEKINAAKTQLGIPSTTPVLPDLGHSPVTPEFSVQEQMKLAQDKGLQKPEVFYFIRDKVNLLTSWLPGQGAFNYDPAAAMANFGRCSLPDDKLKFKTPGSCAAGGGRTGASVKIISRDALLSDQHKIGGAAGSAGGIMNPPKGDGW